MKKNLLILMAVMIFAGGAVLNANAGFASSTTDYTSDIDSYIESQKARAAATPATTTTKKSTAETKSLSTTEKKIIQNKTAKQAVADISNELSRKYETFYGIIAGDNYVDYETVGAAAQDFSDATLRAKQQYEAIESATDKQDLHIKKLIRNTEKLNSAAEEMIESANSESYIKFSSATSNLANAVDENNELFDEWNDKYAGRVMVNVWFASSIITGIIFALSGLFYFLTRKQDAEVVVESKVGTGKLKKVVKEKKTLKSSRLNVLIGAGVLFAGALIPVIQIIYMQSNNQSGEYTVMLYPLVFGTMYFIAGVFNYISIYIKSKKAGNLTKNESEKVFAKSSEGSEIVIPEIGSKDPNKK